MLTPPPPMPQRSRRRFRQRSAAALPPLPTRCRCHRRAACHRQRHCRAAAGWLELSCRERLRDRTFHRQRKQKDGGEGPTWLVSIRVNPSYTSRGGGCIFLCRHHIFLFPMPAQKLISWHITIFAVHAFSAVTLFFFVRITRWVVLILYFSPLPLRNSFLYTSRYFF